MISRGRVDNLNQNSIVLDFKSQRQLKGLYLIYKLAENLDETTRKQTNLENANLVWSTTFIQSFFACDTLGNYDWLALLEGHGIDPWPVDIEISLSQVDKMREMVKFCYNVLEDKAPVIFNRILADMLVNIKNPCEALGARSLAVSTFSFQANFQERFRQIIQKAPLTTDEHMLLVYKMLRFIYTVRDNIFEGLTIIANPMDEFMPLRFQIYSDVLLSACGLLFHTVEYVSDWRHQDVDIFNTKYSYTNKAIEESKLRNMRRSAVFTRKDS